ncbi:MAG: hypothetical protein QHJ81_13675 [Anaerolineae bacterium]|nr:hypothetical protein [Anaerolineae bacterium]
MKSDNPPSRTSRFLVYALAYLLWLVSAAVCAAAVIQVRSTVNVLWVALGRDRYSLGLVNQVVLLLGGLAAFTYAVFLEGYYRAGAKRPYLLLQRFGVMIAIPLGVFLLALIMLEVTLRIMR